MNPNSLSNLRPFKKGDDPRRSVGKRPSHRAKIRTFLDLKGGEHEGVSITLEERIVLRAIQDACNGDRHAREWLFNRVYGKPKESVTINGKVQHAHLVGRRLEELSDAELDLVIADPESFEPLPDGTIARKDGAVEAEFKDMEPDIL